MRRDRTASIELVAEPNPPHHGQEISFTVTCEDPKPMVTVTGLADVDGVGEPEVVYREQHRVWESIPDDAKVFTLRSSVWTEGEAVCVAELYRSDYKGGFITLASTTFEVAA